MNKLTLISYLIFLLSYSGTCKGSTPQIPDILLFEGDTLFIQTNPLASFEEQHNLDINSYFTELCISTACWRGYQAVWKIEQEKLYLIAIQDCCSEQPQKIDLKAIFEKKIKNGRVLADWFSGKIHSGQGELIYYVHMGYQSVYEKDLIFNFEKGRLLGHTIQDNSPTRGASFPGGMDSLRDYVYSNLVWSEISIPQEECTVVVMVEVDTTGKAVVSSVQNPMDGSISEQLAKIFNEMPRWDVGYYKGEKVEQSWGIPIKFNAKIRERYHR